MDELCPLCLKMGWNRRIKAVQINLDEAIWMCENEECPWPFGYEVPDVIPRKVGEKWAYEWETYKKVQKRVGPIPVSTELSLYTPPVTPSGDVATKETGKSDLSSVTSIADMTNNSDPIFSSISMLDDSYAPKTAELTGRNSNELQNDSNSAKKMPSPWETDFSILSKKSSILPSIFDIDGDELLSKISINGPCLEPEMAQKSVPSDILDVRNSKKNPGKVLQASDKPEITLQKTMDVKKEIIVSPIQNNITKGIPQIISISKTNIDFSRKNSKKMTKIDQTEVSIKVEPQSDDEMMKSTRRKSLDDIDKQSQIPGQCTTTITVDGIPPITVSYDLADLGDKTNEIVPVTSTPVRQEFKRNSTELLDDKSTLELMNESPRKLTTSIVSKRRAAKSKQYEKFSFSALKKIDQDSKECIDRTMIDSSKTATIKVEEITNVKEEKPETFCSSVERISSMSAVDNLEKCSTNSDLNRPNQTAPSLISVSHDLNNSIVSEQPSVENLNIGSVLDDMLMEEYQNATENLNDDWLESFFT